MTCFSDMKCKKEEERKKRRKRKRREGRQQCYFVRKFVTIVDLTIKKYYRRCRVQQGSI